MSYRSKGTIAAILLGSISLISIFSYFISRYYFNNIKTIKNIQKDEIFNSDETINNKQDNKNEQELEKIVEVDEDIVEDGEDDEEEEEEEENNEEEKEKKLLDEYKSKYDDATRLAKKYLDGQLYIKAATKFSEAIDLASHIPSASKDILTLYNNRSAMYEKANEFQKALSDITVVLAMDIKHLKARSRRARIYEAQGKFREALNDYIFVMLLEQLTQRPSTNIYKVDEICKRVSKEDANVLLNDLKVKLDRPLPSKSYCKSFFEALPDIHFWREKYIDYNVEELINTFNNKKSLESGLELIKFYISNNLFTKAFDDILLKLSNYLPNEQTNEVTNSLVSLYYELLGINAHLRCGFNTAIESYEKAISYNASNYQIKLKLASIYMELGEINKAEILFEEIFNHFGLNPENFTELTIEQSIDLSFFYLHRSSLWTSKDDDGKIRDSGVDNSLADIQQVLKLTEALLFNNIIKEVRVAALLKLVQINTHSKSQLGQQTTEEDLTTNRLCVDEAKLLQPNNVTTLLLDADLSTVEGNLPLALEKVDKVIDIVGDSDALPYVIKANVLTQKAFQQMNDESTIHLSQQTFLDSTSFYNKALTIDPNSIEALTQLSQVKQMFGDIANSVELAEKSMKLGRNKDELQEICQLYNNAKAQKAALEALKITGM